MWGQREICYSGCSWIWVTILVCPASEERLSQDNRQACAATTRLLCILGRAFRTSLASPSLRAWFRGQQGHVGCRLSGALALSGGAVGNALGIIDDYTCRVLGKEVLGNGVLQEAWSS